MQIILLLGLILIIGLAAGRIFEKFGIPQVVGYIIVGVIFGESFTRILSQNLLDMLSPLTSIALAIIGFMIGGELKYSIIRKYGKQFFVILLFEGLLAMFAVTTLVTLWTGNLPLGILLGALSSATAPAATVDVLWEYKSRGPLTTTILAIVAMDDGLSLILYSFAFAYTNVLISGEPLSLKIMLIKPLIEIFGSILLGVITGFLLDKGLQLLKKNDDKLVITLGSILLASGISVHFELSLIFTCMVTGMYVTNIHPHRNESNFEIIKSVAPPIYIIFFIFIGARLQLGLLTTMGVTGLLYVLGRTTGKWVGSYLGARFSNSPKSVRKYLGFALFSQAGVALGLALDTYQHLAKFGPEGAVLGHKVINIIAATTFLVQIIGPPAVKYAISKAGEITENS